MYKRICTPIVLYKFDRKGYHIHKITIQTSNYNTIQLYSSNEEDCMILPTKNEAIRFVLNLLKINGFKPKFIGTEFNSKWYNIYWIDVESNAVRKYGYL